jgi:hypothetical protein
LLHVLILDSGVMKYLASKFRTTETKSSNRKEYAMVHTYLTCQYGAILSSDAVLFSEKCKHTVLKFSPNVLILLSLLGWVLTALMFRVEYRKKVDKDSMERLTLRLF